MTPCHSDCGGGREEADYALMVADNASSASHIRYYDVYSADDTRLRAWTNDADGPTILLSNGLGTNPYSWPALMTKKCGVKIISWNHRGVGGSERPVDGRADMDSYIEDAVAVMDDAGVTSAVVASWSHGVTIAFELAARYPERVEGILAVAGVPGNTFATMLAPMHIPRPIAKQIMLGVTRIGYLGGPLLAPVTKHIPWTRTTAAALKQTGFIGKAARTRDVQIMLKEFCTTDPKWYAHLALGISQGTRVPLSGVRIPVTFIAGRFDILTGARDMKSAAERIPDARFIELRGSHFLTLEQPTVIHDELLALVDRVETLKSMRAGS